MGFCPSKIRYIFVSRATSDGIFSTGPVGNMKRSRNIGHHTPVHTWTPHCNVEFYSINCFMEGHFPTATYLIFGAYINIFVLQKLWDWKTAWWRHQMETFSALLAICAGNSPVPGEFPTQRPVTRSFDVYFDLRPNKWLSKQSWGWWFETLSCSLWRHRNGRFLIYTKWRCPDIVVNMVVNITWTRHVAARQMSHHLYWKRVAEFAMRWLCRTKSFVFQEKNFNSLQHLNHKIYDYVYIFWKCFSM